MEALKGLGLAILSAGFIDGAIASPGQRPLLDAGPEASSPLAEKPLIDSQALQDAISIDRLLDSAKDLYEIANLSWPEYNHPTRVIGSEGNGTPDPAPDEAASCASQHLLTKAKVTSEHWSTSGILSPASMTTIRGRLRLSLRIPAASLSIAWCLVMMWLTRLHP